MKRGSHHRYETKRTLSLRVRRFWTPEERAHASRRTRERMNNPIVRARISEGMRRIQREARDGP